MEQGFKDRTEAGRALGAALSHYRDRQDLLVLGLPRGGVPVAYQVAKALNAPLDVFVVRKLGFPGHEEFAMGAIASGGVRVLNPELRGHLTLGSEVVQQVAAREAVELERREALYRRGRESLRLGGRCIILVDDGLATGSTMRAAVAALRTHEPAQIVVAVPVASPQVCADLAREVDEIVCAVTPVQMAAVGRWYRDFEQTSDAEVQHLLALAPRDTPRTAQPGRA